MPAEKTVSLIVDNLKVHHAKKVKKWAAAHAHEIELFYLPAYAPDHNPDAYLNNDLKQQLRQQPPTPPRKTSCSRAPAPCCAPSSTHSTVLQASQEPQAVGYAA